MPLINIKVRNLVAEADHNEIVSNNNDYQIRFKFDEAWNEYGIKTARFIYGGNHTDVVFTGDTCDVPMMEGVESVQVGVFAGDLHTTTPASIYVRQSVLDLSGGEQIDPPEGSVYDRILDAINGTSAEVERIEGGAVITITDLHGTTEAVVYDGHGGGGEGEKGEKGDPGQAATIRVGSVTTGEAGSEAQVVNSGTESDAVFDFVIPEGASGVPGSDGFSPYVNIVDGVGIHTITITDKYGEHTAIVNDGINGADGYTPIKGKDYVDGKDGIDGKDYILTESDKTDIAVEAAQLVPIYDDSELRTAIALHSSELETQASDIDNLETEVNNRVADVKINGASIVDGGVAELPIANASNKLGLIQGGWYKFIMDANGRPQCYAMTRKEEYAPESNYMFVSKGTLNTVLANPSIMPALTDAEKAAARARMGVEGKYELLTSVTVSEAVKMVSANVGSNIDGVIVVAHFKGTVAVSNAVIRLRHGSTIRKNVYYGSILSTVDRYAHLIAERDGFWRNECTVSNGNGWTTNIQTGPEVLNTDSSSDIDALDVYAADSAMIEAGSKVDIYVRRA